MPLLYITPASISYQTQFLLSLVIFIYLAFRFVYHHNREAQAILLLAFIGSVTIFLGLMFFDVSLLPAQRLYGVYLENTVLAIALVFLIQFAYHFPKHYANRKWEAVVVCALSLLYALYEGQYALYRYQLMLNESMVDYRPQNADYILIFVTLWMPVAFARQSLAADQRPVSWIRKLVLPENHDSRTARTFALIFSSFLILSVINVLRGHSIISTSVYNISLSIGTLITLWLFATAYINHLRKKTPFIVKVTATTITLLFVLQGAIGWLVSPFYTGLYNPNLQTQQTIRFTPNTAGGYYLSTIPYHFEADYGERLMVSSQGSERNHKVNFHFPFFNQTYSKIYVTSLGLIKMGSPLYHPNLQLHQADLPALMPLLIDMEPAGGGGVFARADAERLIVTWDRLPALFQPEYTFTFQAVLYTNGAFEFSYAELPEHFIFALNANPSANLWRCGISAGLLEAVTIVSDLSQVRQSDSKGVAQDFNLAFRQHLHGLLMPFFWLVFGSCGLVLIALPSLFHFTFNRPLDALLTGVREIETGNLHTQVSVYYPDEIGFLAQAFNRLVTRLLHLVDGLEEQVNQRTQELTRTNAELRGEIELREATQRQALEQQRILAAFNEREQMSRELHDGLGQFVGYISLQTQATREMLAKGDYQAVEDSLKRIGQAAEKSQADIRRIILGLRTSQEQGKSLLASLQEHIAEYQAHTGIRVHLSLPEVFTMPSFPPPVEMQILHITQEALVNVHKHAGAQRVNVIFSFDDRSLQMMISDDGKGFQVQQRMSDGSHHFGLTMMRERAHSVGGRLEIRSQPGVGTRVILYLPILIPAQTQDTRQALVGLRILLVDDSPLFTEGLTNLLVARGFTIVGIARDGIEAQQQAKLLFPDVIIMDIMMPRCDGIAAIQALKAELPDTRILVLTASERQNHLIDAIRNGASGYLLKGMDANEFCIQLINLVRGETILPPTLALQVIGNTILSASSVGSASLDNLTERQQHILMLVAQGLTYKEIGTHLHLSERTIKYHMAKILETLQLQSRAQAIAYTQQHH